MTREPYIKPNEFEFYLDDDYHTYVYLARLESGALNVCVSAGPDLRDVYQRDVSGCRDATLSPEQATDFLVALQAWIEQLTLNPKERR